MKILFLSESTELLEDDWPLVPRINERVQLDQGEMVVTFRVRSVVWRRGFVRVHVTRDHL